MDITSNDNIETLRDFLADAQKELAAELDKAKGCFVLIFGDYIFASADNPDYFNAGLFVYADNIFQLAYKEGKTIGEIFALKSTLEKAIERAFVSNCLLFGRKQLELTEEQKRLLDDITGVKTTPDKPEQGDK